MTGCSCFKSDNIKETGQHVNWLSTTKRCSRLGRCPGGGHDNLLQIPAWGIPRDRGACRLQVTGSQNQTRLKKLSMAWEDHKISFFISTFEKYVVRDIINSIFTVSTVTGFFRPISNNVAYCKLM